MEERVGIGGDRPDLMQDVLDSLEKLAEQKQEAVALCRELLGVLERIHEGFDERDSEKASSVLGRSLIDAWSKKIEGLSHAKD